MAVEFYVNGYFEMSFFNLHLETKVDKDIEQGILDNLQQGEYIISMNEKVIHDINDLQTPLYSFELNPTTALNYEFENL